MRAIARAMEIMGNPVANRGDSYLAATSQVGGFDELKKIKNVALVMVEATVPATGARRGDQVDCIVSAINGKSLDGGRLAFASLQGPNTQDQRVYALCARGRFRSTTRSSRWWASCTAAARSKPISSRRFTATATSR